MAKMPIISPGHTAIQCELFGRIMTHRIVTSQVTRAHPVIFPQRLHKT